MFPNARQAVNRGVILPYAMLEDIHNRLTAAFPGCRVILGGSHAYGGAEEGSDADFYVIAPWWRHILNRLRRIRTEVPVIFMPEFFARRGWYYVRGRYADGREYRSGIDIKTIFRNSLKLGFWNLERGNLKKAAKCAATARAMLGKPDFTEPVFSDAFFAKNRVIALTDADSIKSELRSLTADGLQLMALTFSNWLIYNLHFLKRGDLTWLFKNPDAHVLRQLLDGRATSEAIFPIVIVN